MTKAGPTVVVDGVDYKVGRGEIFGIAGESGSGKTISMLGLLGLLPPGSQVHGAAHFGGMDLLSLDGKGQRAVRGRDIAIVFQDPMTSLHPMLSIEHQMTDHMRHHLGVDRGEARHRAIDLLGEVRIPDPVGALRSFPHQFSGGMRQRIAIAIALACRPQLLIADEPTTALDVTVQAGILRLLNRLRVEGGLSVMLITHDLGVMSAIADRVSVFYAGRIVESGPTRQVLQHARHPYTDGLLHALPHPEAARESVLVPLRGAPPSPQTRPPGCAFHPRCSYALDSCRAEVPTLEGPADHQFACPVDPLVEATGVTREP